MLHPSWRVHSQLKFTVAEKQQCHRAMIKWWRQRQECSVQSETQCKQSFQLGLFPWCKGPHYFGVLQEDSRWFQTIHAIAMDSFHGVKDRIILEYYKKIVDDFKVVMPSQCHVLIISDHLCHHHILSRGCQTIHSITMSCLGDVRPFIASQYHVSGMSDRLCHHNIICHGDFRLFMSSQRHV